MTGLSVSRSRVVPLTLSGLGALLLLAPSEAAAGVPLPSVVEGQIVVQEGDTPTGGDAVAEVRPPFVNDAGEVGFVGTFVGGDHFLWIGNAVVWSGSDDAMNILTDLESRMDSNGAGNWVYPIDVNGADGLYTDAGVFAVAGDPVPGLMNTDFSFLGNPEMTSDGTIYAVVGLDTNGDGFTDDRALVRTPDGTLASLEIVLASGDTVDMFTIDNQAGGGGIDFNYAVAADNSHRVNVLNMTGDPTVDTFFALDDMLLHRELDPTGDGDNWDNFSLVAVNAAGSYLFTGDTDGPTGSDNFLAYNGTVVVREGDMIAGITLPAGVDSRFIAINDVDQITHAWGYPTGGGFRETVFFACNPADIPGSSYEVMTTIESQLDTDGDGMGDYTIVDITMTAPTISKALGETSFVYVEAALDDGMSVTNSMLEIPINCCGNGSVDPSEECDDGNDVDTDDCTTACVAAFCGDGLVQDGVEECDDGNDVDTDDCPTTCVAATCGDGFVLDGTEDCDDGNDVDGDGCESDCTVTPATGSTGGGDSTGGGGSTGGGMGTGGDGSGGDSSGGGGPPTATLSAGGSSSGGDTDTDTDGGGEFIEDDGCGCHTGDNGRSGIVWGLLGLGLVGLRRRRRALVAKTR